MDNHIKEGDTVEIHGVCWSTNPPEPSLIPDAKVTAVKYRLLYAEWKDGKGIHRADWFNKRQCVLVIGKSPCWGEDRYYQGSKE